MQGIKNKDNRIEAVGFGTDEMRASEHQQRMEVYGKDGWPAKDYNKGHQGKKTPKVERTDHVHDYKPNPNHPDKKPDRQTGRAPKRNELAKDKAKMKIKTNESNQQ